MNALHRIRRRSGRLARLSAGLFVPVWLTAAAAPCAMAMSLDAAPEHDCPHCPPVPCHQAAPESCDEPDSIDAPRIGDSTPTALAPPVSVAGIRVAARRGDDRDRRATLPPPRAGPRAHVLHVQFNE